MTHLGYWQFYKSVTLITLTFLGESGGKVMTYSESPAIEFELRRKRVCRASLSSLSNGSNSSVGGNAVRNNTLQ